MPTVPLATCARLRGIHPKTLHYWLKAAHLPLAPHPTDARIRCVAEEHLLEVARLHSRSLPDLPGASVLDGHPAPALREEQAKPLPAHGAVPAHLAASLSAPSAALADLIQQLAQLETHVATLQQHLTGLALELLQERTGCSEQRLSALEALLSQTLGGGKHPSRPRWRVFLIPPLLQSLACCLRKCEPVPA
jgi:hypothetical protein